MQELVSHEQNRSWWEASGIQLAALAVSARAVLALTVKGECASTSSMDMAAAILPTAPPLLAHCALGSQRAEERCHAGGTATGLPLQQLEAGADQSSIEPLMASYQHTPYKVLLPLFAS